ncbi:hypothetical protein D9758_008775 [Tetrapyrgos nigripes]|uniref:CFEM domain-containing protein n=1 Tax=Tetrapyrgos nigripes TaxID=182062 RepID=A0A8H5D6I2_9AGAR|nr:hypothetical protein D9758_008775 [Tetrapyrgos nigripes]
MFSSLRTEMLRSSTTLPLSLILLSLSLVLQWQILPGAHAQASQAPPTTFGSATESGSRSGSLTGSAVSGSATASNSSSVSASTTNTADLPSLSGYSTCGRDLGVVVCACTLGAWMDRGKAGRWLPHLWAYWTRLVNCFQMAIGQAGCNSVVSPECYCGRANYTSFLLSCMQSNCSSELSTVESLTNQFCAIASPSTSVSFAITAFPSSGSGSASGSGSGSGNGSSSASATGPSVSDAGTSNAAMRRGPGTLMDVAGGHLVGVALTLGRLGRGDGGLKDEDGDEDEDEGG